MHLLAGSLFTFLCVLILILLCVFSLSKVILLLLADCFNFLVLGFVIVTSTSNECDLFLHKQISSQMTFLLPREKFVFRLEHRWKHHDVNKFSPRTNHSYIFSNGAGALYNRHYA